jgi:hypothetical protein
VINERNRGTDNIQHGNCKLYKVFPVSYIKVKLLVPTGDLVGNTERYYEIYFVGLPVCKVATDIGSEV